MHKCLCNTIECEDFGTVKCRIPKNVTPGIAHVINLQIQAVFSEQHKKCPECPLMLYFYSLLDFMQANELYDEFLQFNKESV